MIPRKYLINLKKEFPRIRKEGKIYDSPSFGLVVSYSSANYFAQCATIVSKKIDKKSVIRHQIKRKFSDAISPFLPRLPKSTELVFLTKQKAITTTVDDLQKELKLILTRAHLIPSQTL